MNNILDKDKFSKRASRYIQLTGEVGGLLAKLGANRYLGVDINKDQHALNLKKNLIGKRYQNYFLGKQKNN